ncbi:MAG TPA: FAD-dependent oxidoreductase, partial [Campylobacterales bacterium]|nr:FAD-dependent oxidoreductase [Campylobacterales bacterium]
MYDVIIIGAGASGLVCAIVSARRGKKVLILEKNNKVGKKLLATGNG